MIQRKYYQAISGMLSLILCTNGWALTSVPVEVFVRNVNWPANLTVSFQVSYVAGSGNIEDVLPLPPYSSPYTFTASTGNLAGDLRVFYLRNLGTPKLSGTLHITYTATVAGQPHATITKSYNPVVTDNAVNFIMLYFFIFIDFFG